ncbi:Peptidoglycan-binding Lysin subgroup [Corchorus capsularis]|uniref:Peptidoglycan-binding Lysin subgroup n=1 Tax=Corchorus capsularis TaxID=210143 RepID=A0A1R3IMQ8_COCAP|nr:Peptidoglycan-binding Lysin subgroup [Corchorus capsularis]
MSNPSSASNDGDKHSGDNMDAAVAKTAGFVVFSGIAMSILKTLNPFNKDKNNATPTPQQPVAEWTQPSLSQPIRDSPPPPPPPEPIITKNEAIYTEVEQRLPEYNYMGREIEIVRGDTLWGLSRKYGVSIDAIKEANGLTGDTIYAGKKLIIP